MASKSSAVRSGGGEERCSSTGLCCWLVRRRTPELLGVCDVADESAGNHDWSDRLLAANSSALWDCGALTPGSGAVRARALELQHARYQNPAWTGLR